MFYIRDFKRGYFKQDLTQHESLDDFDTHGGYSMFEAESIYAEKKLYELKMSIVKKGWPIKYFSSSIELGELVLQDWTKLLNLLFPKVYIRNGK